MADKKGNVKNPKEAIYLSLFEKPLNLGELSDRLYGKLNTKVSTYLTELENEGWVEYIRNEEQYRFKKGEKKDNRKSYYKATSEGLFVLFNSRLDKFAEDKKVSKLRLSKDEAAKLKGFFCSTAIKNYIIDLIKHIDFRKDDCSDLIVSDIALHCLYLETINVYYQKKTGIDSTDPRVIQNAIKQLKTKDRVLEKIEWHKLGLTLQSKLTNLLGLPTANSISYYFDHLILFTERMCQKLS